MFLRLHSDGSPLLSGKGVRLYDSFQALMLMIAFASLIVAILSFTNKK